NHEVYFCFPFIGYALYGVNAILHQLLKRTTTFNQCEKTHPQLTVILSPDPVVPGETDTFTISDPVAKAPIGNPTTAPADLKTPFSQVLNVNVPATLPNPYGIIAAVGTQDTHEIIGCEFNIVETRCSLNAELCQSPPYEIQYIISEVMSIVDNELKWSFIHLKLNLSPGVPPPPQLLVLLSPDPVIPGQTDEFSISGTLSRAVIDGDITGVAFFDPKTGDTIGDPSSAPTDPKTPFSQVLNVNVPATLPNPYGISAAVQNQDTQEIIGCSLTIVGGSAESADLEYYPIPLL
ncbi:2008_t:CDS:2, partial [Entrophospora sp. SA101]